MSKKEKDIYYKSLKNLSSMNIAQIEFNKKDRIIAEKENALSAMRHINAEKENVIAAMKKENAELRRKLGLN